MAYGIVIQPWTTVVGATNQIVTQPEASWVNTRDFQDAGFVVEIATTTTNANVTNLDFQASPSKDSTLFDGASISLNFYLARFAYSSAGSAGVQGIQIVRFATATNQLLAEWLRWKLTFAAAGPTSITFRAWLILNVG